MILSKGNKLNSPVLVLNRFYMAIQIITARRAFVMLCRDAAEVIDREAVSYTHLTLPTILLV